MGATVKSIETEGEDMIEVMVERQLYKVKRGQASLDLPDGRRAMLRWFETFPEKFGGYDVEPMRTPLVLWRGTLATGGRKAEEFQAEVIRDVDGEVKILAKKGLETRQVSIHEVRVDYWVKAFAEVCDQLRTHEPPAVLAL